METAVEERRQCTGHKRTGERCTKAPIVGATVCWTHGGAAPQVRATAQRRLAEAKARSSVMALVAVFEGSVDGDPQVELLRMVKLAACSERAYAMLVDDLPAPLIAVDRGRVGGVQTEPHPYLILWNQERDRLAKMAKAALDAGIAQRQVEIAEGEARSMADLMLSVISDVSVGLDGEAQSRLRVAIATRLRLAA